MSQILTGVLSGVISAVAASIIVVLFTTFRLRKERGFDRRLVWCESMMSAINAAGAAVSSASTSDDPGGREDCWSETIRLYEELIPLCGLKEIYAPRAGVEEIQAFMRELEILISWRASSRVHEKTRRRLRRVAPDGRLNSFESPLVDAKRWAH